MSDFIDRAIELGADVLMFIAVWALKISVLLLVWAMVAVAAFFVVAVAVVCLLEIRNRVFGRVR